MNAVSVDRQRNSKAIGPERQTGLEIVLLKRTYVFPWSQFLTPRVATTKYGRCSPPMT
jgi:hypothetical protein